MGNYGRTIGNYGTITFFNGDLQAMALLLVESRTSGIANNKVSRRACHCPNCRGCRKFTRYPNEDRKKNIYHKHLEMFVFFFWGVEFDRFRRNEENEESWHHSIESCDIVRYRGIFKQGILNLLTYLTSNRRRETPAHSCNSDHLHVLKNRETAHGIATVLSWLVINYPIWGN